MSYLRAAGVLVAAAFFSASDCIPVIVQRRDYQWRGVCKVNRMGEQHPVLMGEEIPGSATESQEDVDEDGDMDGVRTSKVPYKVIRGGNMHLTMHDGVATVRHVRKNRFGRLGKQKHLDTDLNLPLWVDPKDIHLVKKDPRKWKRW
ncbi:MAG: hypothetical protein QF486_01560 [Candidatus Woesearchaeota archaeon]|jgi:hypothetical protein|nr:hypothetical protein [Candidatus Woesearchaeota archaeon]MDP7181099.1 hypothetical protein [Candidatus Woesearchaeota archaeon]MDP7198280.1 hypothetical protein [Candidatus Woesearchaeota archaeon]MDP7467382.1 hypothetical protein [Candidatus Woesearchaeota archaeon]MDP7647609.1 hypothetical protein [Candidatus Woesearchaeota archaeon]|tara:strand:- start:730 stop:1167 length:438 start_codon:yes stop_codon:yes gene_type:complete